MEWGAAVKSAESEGPGSPWLTATLLPRQARKLQLPQLLQAALQDCRL